MEEDALIFPQSPIEAYCDLPKEVRLWFEKPLAVEQMKQGLRPDFADFWESLTESEQWQLVGDLIEQSAPLDRPCPKVTLAKRAAPLRTPSLNKEPDCVPVSDYSKSDTTEKVKKILLTASKIRFIGAEGCGKTSKARWLCRERIALGHKVYWINPHLNADDNQKLKAAGVTIVGGGRDYQAIADFCLAMVDGDSCELSKNYEKYASVVGAKFPPVTFVLDELTNYKDEVGEPIEKFIKASMQEFSKISWHTIYITHNDTLACMGAPNGTANLIKASVFDLRLETDILRGNRVPKAIAQYRMPNTDNWQPVTIPVEWQ